MSAASPPLGWEWRTGLTEFFEDPYEELVDERGNVVASVDRLSNPPEYTVMGTRHMLVPEDWKAQPGGNVAITSAPEIRMAVIDELAHLGMVPAAATPSASLAEEALGSIAASKTLAQGRNSILSRAPPTPSRR